MDRAPEWVISLLEKDAVMWEEAATSAEALVPHLPSTEEKQRWVGIAEKYRANAESQRALAKELREKSVRSN